MIIKESQSLEFFCPMGFAQNGKAPSDPILCSGAKCAAWRWVEDVPCDTFPTPVEMIVLKGCSCGEEFVPADFDEKVIQRDGAGYFRCNRCGDRLADYKERPLDRRGRCGMAGGVGYGG